jgi:phosphoenolpyruvate carboxykinase (ATP)
MQQVGPRISDFGLENHGISNVNMVHWNYSTPALYEQALQRREGWIGHGGALVTRTGHHTGRSPNDKFIVAEDTTKNDINWGKINTAISEAHFEILRERMLAYVQGRDIFVQDCFAGADPEYRLPVRIINETAWHNLFARNMFFWARPEQYAGYKPEYTVIHMPGFHAMPELDGTNSEVFIAVHYAKKLVLIGGSSYAGEIKKSIFSVLNYLLPPQGVLPMHCSANIGPNGDTAIFFGLSGTGKTTLSADSSRTLIGDDEHGWSPNGIFNFEEGCYAKVIKLSPEAEPDIFLTTKRFATILENVGMDMSNRRLDLDDDSLTENTRASYPLSHIANASETGMGGQPSNIVMLTCDAFGVLPPISQLRPEQAMYHFLSGYTAKVAGTEKGVKEPSATFSACFGAPFMPRHPTVYAKMLGEKMAQQNAKCWLVNTGWSGGGYGAGERMRIAYTRAMLNAALDGKYDGVAMRTDPNFGLMVPESAPDVPADVLDPRKTWSDKAAYDAAASHLTKLFEDNFKQYEDHVDDKVKAAAIHAK